MAGQIESQREAHGPLGQSDPERGPTGATAPYPTNEEHTMYATNLSVFTRKDAVRDFTAEGGTQYAEIDTSATEHRVRIDFHIGNDAYVPANTNFDRDEHSFSTVHVEGKRNELVLYVSADAIDEAVALRDALTKAIAFARKHAR